MEKIDFKFNFILFLLVVLAFNCIIANVIIEKTFNDIVKEYEEEIIYPERFIIPSDARRIEPFYMPANLRNEANEETQENQ